jgi:hypothetical protein
MLTLRRLKVGFAIVVGLLSSVPLAGRDSTGAICADPGNETFEQMIQRHYREAHAVFSGEVRELTVERATVAVIETWKGDLSAGVVMDTGAKEHPGGVRSMDTEGFLYRQGQKYVLFAFGKTANGRFVGPLSTSICRPNVNLTRAGSTIAVLDAIAGRPPRPRSDQNEPVVSLEEIVACVAAGTCRNMQPGTLTWFDTVGNRVSAFTADGFGYGLAVSGNLLRIWITQPGEGRPSRLLTVAAGGRVLRAEMGPIPGEGGPRRMSAEERDSWRRAHKVYAAADAPGSGWVGGNEFYPVWQEQAARAWNAIQRQLTR